MDPLEDRHLLSFAAGPVPPSPPAQAVAVAPVGDGPHQPSPVVGPCAIPAAAPAPAGPENLRQAAMPARDHPQAFLEVSSAQAVSAPTAGRIVLAVAVNPAGVPAGVEGDRSRLALASLRIPAPEVGRADQAAPLASPRILAPEVGRADQAAPLAPRPVPSVSIVRGRLERPGATPPASSGADWLAVSAPWEGVILPIATAPIQGPAGPTATPEARPMVARASVGAPDLPVSGRLRGDATDTLPEAAGVEEREPLRLLESDPTPIPVELPLPLGADLIARLAPFDGEALDRALARIRAEFERPDGPTAAAAGGRSHLLIPLVAALGAFEAARRRRNRRRSLGTVGAWKAHNTVWRGFS